MGLLCFFDFENSFLYNDDMETDEQKLERICEKWSKELLDEIEERFWIHIEKVLTEQRIWYQNCATKMFKELTEETDATLKLLKGN